MLHHIDRLLAFWHLQAPSGGSLGMSHHSRVIHFGNWLHVRGDQGNTILAPKARLNQAPK